MDYHPLADIDPKYFADRGNRLVVLPTERRLLSQIARGRNLSRTALAEQLGMARETLHDAIMALCDRRLIYLGNAEAGGPDGKTTPRLLLNPRYCCAVGVAVESSHAGIALMDFAGSVWSRSIPVASLSMDEVLSRIDGEISALLLETGFARDDIFGLGFCVEGQVRDRTAFLAIPTLPSWSKVHFGPLLQQWYGLPIWTQTAAQAAAGFENRSGLGKKAKNFVHLSVGQSLAAGLILDGQLRQGALGNAGGMEGLMSCDVAKRPTLEGLQASLCSHGADIPDMADFVTSLDIRSAGVRAWLSDAAPTLLELTAILQHVVDPEVVVVGGRMPKHLAKALVDHAVSLGSKGRKTKKDKPDLVMSELPEDSAAMGAAWLPFAQTFF
ncbi:ROK family transcriptional regulator [uncultured Cohaesibacter sp.]|uniref:ROK family protein n=1 Tax=uncultured Cohaesibacter sp. TaxID=1002546 RepID=UPI0029C63D5C|nr:ROK family transcriptional regulator [uncultured Cohaesibacter sp.]